jgi:two-component system response regulator AtoC
VARREAAVLERRGIIDALARAGGNKTRAATLLRISRRTLMKKLDLYGIVRPRKGRRRS